MKSSAIRRAAIAAVVMVGALVGGVVGGVAMAPAHAAGEIGVSTDGISFASQLDVPLFAAGTALVPGDVVVREVQVRNDGPSAGVLDVAIIAGDGDGLLSSGDLVLEAQVGDGAWTSVAPGESAAAGQVAVARSARTTLRLRASLVSDSQRQGQSVPLQVRLTLSESGSVAGEAQADPSGAPGAVDGAVDGSASGDADGVLPGAGASVPMAALWLGAGAIGAGLALVSRRRGAPGPGRAGGVR